ncbi:MAG: molybdopterin-dependent oxidoreductase [Acidobacteria bacterium]|nr:molybdopterin-dependent oxidoreductase [Acidobacteriota bacterium]
MVSVTIDGHEIQVPEGTNVLEAAKKAGITIPHYCYHPALSVVGQCRVCMVEIDGAPKLATACSTQVRDGMNISTNSERATEARQAVLEFLLANHPLDCPVCDQAGECYLQDYAFDFGLDTTHMVEEKRTYPERERRMLGPHVIQNQNRCIHCTRCIRFTREISETHDLTMKARGNHQYIDTFNGEPYDNPWSACAADVCPVGALTVKEFRFRARVWRLEETRSICPGCSIGCNIMIGHRNGVVYRFMPRENAEINGWWMCDHGRFLAEDLNARDIDRPLIRSGGQLAPATWSDALEELARIIGAGTDARVIASANLSNEALYLAKKLFAEKLGLKMLVPVETGPGRSIKNAHKEWIRSEDPHPNATGARLIGLNVGDASRLQDFLITSSGPVVILDAGAHPLLASQDIIQAIKNQPIVAMANAHTPMTRAADLVFPVASWLEAEGTYTSSTGRVQLAERGAHPSDEAKAAWDILTLMARALGADPGPVTRPQQIFEELAAEVPAFAGMTYRRLSNEPGVPVLEEVAHVG